MTVKDFLLGTWGIVIAIALVLALAIGGWKAGWWLASNSTAHSIQIQIQKQQANGQYQVQEQGASNQDTLREQISKGQR